MAKLNYTSAEVNTLLAKIGTMESEIDTLQTVETIKIHRVTADTSPTANAWTDCSTFIKIAAESSGTAISLNADAKTIEINTTGFYQFGGCVHYQNNSGGDKEPLVASRLLQDEGEAGEVEMKCSQRAAKLAVKDDGENTISYNGTAYLVAGSTVNLQYYVSDSTIDFDSNSVFDSQVAYTLWLKKM